MYQGKIEAQQADYSISSARYAKGKMIVRTPSATGYKTRAARLVGDGLGCKYVGRSGGYTATPAQAERFERLYADGWDGCYISGMLDNARRGISKVAWREAVRIMDGDTPLSCQMPTPPIVEMHRRSPDYKVAMAAGRDAANRSAARAGRSAWNEDDWNAMADTVEKVMACA